MPRRRRIYEGKAKILFEGPEPGTLVAPGDTIRLRYGDDDDE